MNEISDQAQQEAAADSAADAKAVLAIMAIVIGCVVFWLNGMI